ncbi:aspartic peptidase domain-containing protein [Cercophora newfieldiana]|uniref:Aspartic peptidase domain-containing protein n=1 Tax=Cercophora newfieldiana TaxID=92897 RepID=A0AA39XVR8_9PEZI|nr:aspartic peptidase domain-containing protein [Cercophora newfieldiana]
MTAKFSVRALAALAIWAIPEAAASVLPATRPPRVGFTDTVTSHVIPMARHDVPGSHDIHLRRRATNVSTSLTNVHDVYYIIDLLVGKEIIPVSIDTGSSDTWMKPDCGLGEGLKGELSGGIVPNVSFGRQYADGTFVEGYFGFEDVTVGGLTAKRQRLGIVNNTYWQGDGRVSGLLGLAYPYMTSLDGPYETQPLYDPVFTTLWKEKLISPMFSIALSRHVDQSPTQSPVDPSLETSYLALGGLPPVSYDEDSWARTPIQDMSTLKAWGITTKEHGLYILTAEAYVYGNANGTFTVTGEGLSRNVSQFPVTIDAGATLTYMPTILAKKLYASFDPPAELIAYGLYYAKCNAKVPQFGVQFGGKIFWMAPEDLLRQSARDPTKEWCRVGVTDSDSIDPILGVTFLNSVVAVFDVEHHEMRFASRTKY